MKLKFEVNPNLWFGSQESYADFQAALKKAEDYLAASGKNDNMDEEEEDDFADMYEREGSVGVLKINGHLVNGYAGPFFRAWGIIGYEDIAQAAALAAADRQAPQVLLAMASPGGSVAGCNQCSSVLKALAQAKPMTGYADLAASAGYWLFSNAPYLMASETAVTGSIGVIRIHREFSKMEEREGITTTVMRAGKYKMLANPYEPLTDEAKAEIQLQLNDMYDGFIGVVAENRNTTTMIADQVMGQGREFIGKRGLEAGLIDALGSYTEALAYASRNTKLVPRTPVNYGTSATAGIVATEFVAHNGANHGMTTMALKKTLTPEQIAAIAAGASAATVSAETDAPGTEGESQDADDSSATGAATSNQESTEATASVKPDNEIVAFLKTELTAAQTELAKATLQAANAASQVAALQETQASLLGIVQGAVANLGIALSQKIDVAAMDAKALVEAHASMSATFKEKFKVGGVAASTADTKPPETKPDPVVQAATKVDPMFVFATQTLTKK